jgi:hypothetical protein
MKLHPDQSARESMFANIFGIPNSTQPEAVFAGDTVMTGVPGRSAPRPRQ